MWILMYVDDLIVIANNDHAVETIIKMICCEFNCHDLGILKSFLGREVTRQNDGSVMLTQAKYAIDL